MKISIAQLATGSSISQNLNKMLNVIEQSSADVIVFPECMLSGYEVNDKNWLDTISISELEAAVEKICKKARSISRNIIFGTARKIQSDWFNCGIFVDRAGKVQYIYKKINLANADRTFFQAGSSLETFVIDEIPVAIQACREVRYPEQWRYLTLNGVKVIFHLNNAQKAKDVIWKHVLIARAYENQIFVVSVNAASERQQLESFVVDPDGNIIVETQSTVEEIKTAELDLSLVRTDNIDQRRKDLLDIFMTSSPEKL